MYVQYMYIHLYMYILCISIWYMNMYMVVYAYVYVCKYVSAYANVSTDSQIYFANVYMPMHYKTLALYNIFSHWYACHRLTLCTHRHTCL